MLRDIWTIVAPVEGSKAIITCYGLGEVEAKDMVKKLEASGLCKSITLAHSMKANVRSKWIREETLVYKRV